MLGITLVQTRKSVDTSAGKLPIGPVDDSGRYQGASTSRSNHTGPDTAFTRLQQLRAITSVRTGTHIPDSEICRSSTNIALDQRTRLLGTKSENKCCNNKSQCYFSSYISFFCQTVYDRMMTGYRLSTKMKSLSVNNHQLIIQSSSTFTCLLLMHLDLLSSPLKMTCHLCRLFAL